MGSIKTTYINMYNNISSGATNIDINKDFIYKYYDKSIKQKTPGVKKVIYNPPATIVFFLDGTKTTSKCDSTDSFDEMTGFLLCIAKKYMGGERLQHTLEKNVYKDFE